MAVNRIWFPGAPTDGVGASDRALLGIGYGGISLAAAAATWTSISDPSTAWSLMAKPSRGAAPDGFMDDSGDGFFARPHTDGFFASDGTWTPLYNKWHTWTLINKPS